MNRLKELRTEKKLTQKELAKELGIHYRTLQNWETNETQIKPDKAQELADYFGVDVGYLLGFSTIRYDSEQIKKAIKNLSAVDTPINKDSLDRTVAIVEQTDFLDLDIKTIVDLYHYTNDNTKPIENFDDLISFFEYKSNSYAELLTKVEPYEADSIMQQIRRLNSYIEIIISNAHRLTYRLNVDKNDGYLLMADGTVKIIKREKSLSDKEIKALPKDEQKEYTQNSVGEIRKEIRDLNKKMNEFKLAYKNIRSDLTIEQMHELTSDLIKILADIEQTKTSTNSRPTQEKDNL